MTKYEKREAEMQDGRIAAKNKRINDARSRRTSVSNEGYGSRKMRRHPNDFNYTYSDI